MKVIFKAPNGECTLEAKPNETVGELLSRMLITMGSNSSGIEYDFVCSGKVLSNPDHSLASCGVRNNSTVFAIAAPMRIKVEYEGKTRPIYFPNTRDVTVKHVKQIVCDAFEDVPDFSSELLGLKKGSVPLVADDKSIIFNYQLAQGDTLVAYKQKVTPTNDTSYSTTDSNRSSRSSSSSSSSSDSPAPSSSSPPPPSSPSPPPPPAVPPPYQPAYFPKDVVYSPPRDTTKVDLVISVDTSGTLSTIFTELVDIRRFTARLLQDIPELRIGIILHGGFLDYKACAVSYMDLTNDVTKMCKFVEHVTSSPTTNLQAGTYALALNEARHMSWGDGHRILVVIGAGVPHPPSYTRPQFNWREDLDCLKNMGVRVYGACYVQYENSWPFYRELAEKTNTLAIQFKQTNIIEEMLQGICLREISEAKVNELYAEIKSGGRAKSNEEPKTTGPDRKEKGKELRRVASRGGEWEEELKNIFGALALPTTTTSSTQEKPNAPWYNLETDDGDVGYIKTLDTGTWAHAHSSFFPSDHIPKLKLVLVGCTNVGKTFMLIRYANSYPHTGFFSVNLEAAGKTHKLSLFDTRAQQETDNLNPQEYAHTDAFLVCFSLVLPSSLINIEKWCHEISHMHIPFLLVGCKSDMRDVIPKGIPHVTTHQGQKFAKKIGAAEYVECSAFVLETVRGVLEKSVEVVMLDNDAKAKAKAKKDKNCVMM